MGPPSDRSHRRRSGGERALVFRTEVGDAPVPPQRTILLLRRRRFGRVEGSKLGEALKRGLASFCVARALYPRQQDCTVIMAGVSSVGRASQRSAELFRDLPDSLTGGVEVGVLSDLRISVPRADRAHALTSCFAAQFRSERDGTSPTFVNERKLLRKATGTSAGCNSEAFRFWFFFLVEVRRRVPTGRSLPPSGSMYNDE